MSLAKEAMGLFPSAKPQKAQTEQQKRQRKEYYLRNREKLLRESRQWKLEHAARVKKYQKRYKRQVDSGARVPKMRVRAGLGYQFTGTRSKSDSPSESPSVLRVSRERRI